MIWWWIVIFAAQITWKVGDSKPVSNIALTTTYMRTRLSLDPPPPIKSISDSQDAYVPNENYAYI